MKKGNDLKKITLGALALFALAGCNASSVEPAPEPPRCELNAYAVCASIIQNYLAPEAVWPAQAESLQIASFSQGLAPSSRTYR